MTREYSIRQDLVKILAPFGAFPVENPVRPGTPDVCLILGWIELKVAKRPVLSVTKISVDVRNEQRIWLDQWSRVGGKCWTFTLVEGNGLPIWYLHRGSWSAIYLGNVAESIMKTEAVRFWCGEMPGAKELIPELLK